MWDADWREVGDRVYARRYDPADVTVGVVVGADGVLLVDTRCSLVEAAELREDVRRLSTAPIRWVVNTHAHFDHVWGNAEFVAPRQRPPAEIWGHDTLPPSFSGADFEELRRGMAGHDREWADKMAALEVAPPTRLVSDAATLVLGDRVVELRHPGRGHTDGDLLVSVPDANTVFAGDLVESSGPPAFGQDSYPLEWAPTLGAVLRFGGTGTLFVPGHGDPVDTNFVRHQQTALGEIANEVTRLYSAGVPADEALAAGSWPYTWPTDQPVYFVERGYAALRAASNSAH